MTFYSKAYTTNTTWQPEDALLSADVQQETIAYFTITDDSKELIKSRADNSAVPKSLKDNYDWLMKTIPVWKLRIMSMSEIHSDSLSVDKGLSDSITVMSTGINPIGINISGILQMYNEYDFRLDFLYIYDSFFRGYQLDRMDLELQIFVESTVFNFKPFGVQYSQTSGIEDHAMISMSGIAYQYSVHSDLMYSPISLTTTTTTTKSPITASTGL